MPKHKTKAASAPKQAVGVAAMVSTLVVLIVLCIFVRIGIRHETERLHRQARQALSIVKIRARTRVMDAGGMLPANIGRDYRIQAHLQAELGQVEQEYLLLLSRIKHRDSAPPEGLTAGRLTRIFDLCALYRDGDHGLVQEWIAANGPPQILHQHLVQNYFDVAAAAEEAGDITEAKVSYSRFLKLMHMIVSESDLALQTKVQRELTKAEIRVEILSPRHLFASQVFGDFNRENTVLINSEINNPDASIRGLAILSVASEKYHADDYLSTLAFLERSQSDCGPLRAECSFLRLKAAAREAEAQRNSTGPSPTQAAQLRECENGFRQLLDTLPKDHYLRPQSMLWVALVQGWSGNRTAFVDSLRHVVSAFPDTDTAEIAKDVLLSIGEVVE